MVANVQSRPSTIQARNRAKLQAVVETRVLFVAGNSPKLFKENVDFGSGARSRGTPSRLAATKTSRLDESNGGAQEESGENRVVDKYTQSETGAVG